MNRRRWARWHGWLGLGLLLWLLLMAISGVVLGLAAERRAGVAAEPPWTEAQLRAAVAPYGMGRVDTFEWTGDGRLTIWLRDGGADGAPGSGVVQYDRGTDRHLDGQGSFGRLAGWMLALHHALLLDVPGQWAVGVLGLMLAVLVGLGVALAWPPNRRFKPLLWPQHGPGLLPTAFAWHRWLGTWLLLSLAPLLLAGVLLGWAFMLPMTRAPAPSASAAPDDSAQLRAAAVALADARQRAPGRPPVGLEWPADEASPLAVVTLHVEGWRAGSRERLWYQPATGEFLSAAGPGNPARRVVEGAHALHAGGVFGRAALPVTLLLAGSLVGVSGAGCVLWWARRRLRARPAPIAVRTAPAALNPTRRDPA
jgi:uncharacterized iron-regulated membrane protein